MSSSLTTRLRGERVLRDFNHWLEGVPCTEKVIIGGNHDASLVDLGSTAQAILSAAVWLQDSCVMLPLAGIKVYGHGHSEGCSHNCAWQTRAGQAPSICEASCADADVVMTHHCSPAIKMKVLPLTRPLLWASGHWHGHHGLYESDGTVFVNASILDGRSNPSQLPVVVDLPIGNIIG